MKNRRKKKTAEAATKAVIKNQMLNQICANHSTVKDRVQHQSSKKGKTKMNELINVNYNNDKPTILGRDLHEFLDVGTAYKDWFPRMCEYGFTESIDFNVLKIERVQTEGERMVKREVTDHQLTVEMAKEISMLQRNDRGKQARQYFIELEKAWNSPEKVMARALKIAQEELNVLKIENAEMKPKALFADAVSNSKTSILVGELAKLIKQNGVPIGQNRLFEWLRENGYLIKNGISFNMPTQYSMEREWFEIVERTVHTPNGGIKITKTPKVTGRGQNYFINKFLAN